MHGWAITVERLSSRIGSNLKGDGDHIVQELMAVISEAMALEESGTEVSEALDSKIRQCRIAAEPYLRGEA